MRICIVGVGNIGFRYLQGIQKRFPEAEFLLVDHSARIAELEKLQLPRATCLTSLDEVTGPIDVLVIATSCESRLATYKKCLALDPGAVILEKYLFKSREEFDDCPVRPGTPTFVNQWMFGSQSFDRLFDRPVSRVEVAGSNWGLGCNAVHWIDLLKRYLGIAALQAGAQSSIDAVFNSKRAGYEEVYGEWIFEDRHSDKSFRLIDRPAEGAAAGLRIRLDASEEYFFDYTAVRRGENLISRFPYFSEQIGGIVDDLMQRGRCCLPTLEESISQHLLVEDILGTLDRRPNIT